MELNRHTSTEEIHLTRFVLVQRFKIFTSHHLPLVIPIATWVVAMCSHRIAVIILQTIMKGLTVTDHNHRLITLCNRDILAMIGNNRDQKATKHLSIIKLPDCSKTPLLAQNSTSHNITANLHKIYNSKVIMVETFKRAKTIQQSQTTIKGLNRSRSWAQSLLTTHPVGHTHHMLVTQDK